MHASASRLHRVCVASASVSVSMSVSASVLVRAHLDRGMSASTVGSWARLGFQYHRWTVADAAQGVAVASRGPGEVLVLTGHF